MTYQMIYVDDTAPGACGDVGITTDLTTITCAKAWNGTGNFTINTNKFTVATASGNTTVAGTLAVTGATTQTGALGCAASITLGAGADLIGSSTSDITINTDKFTVAGATGNTVVGGTLTVDGATTQTGALGCAASITLGAGADLIGSSTSDITINTDKFTVAGATGNTVVAGTFEATGAQTLTGATSCASTLGVAGIASFAEAAAFGGDSNAATSGAVAIPIDTIYDGYTTNATAAIAATLADGTIGQMKIIKLETKDTNNMVVTPANFNNGTTITFDATGEIALLIFIGTGWEVVYTTATVA